jgi:hypothetical protein
MTDEQGTEAFETMRVLLRDGASADQVRDRLEAADGIEAMPLLLGAVFGLKESLDRFISDEEEEREQARKDRSTMRAAFASLLELAEQQVKLLHEVKTVRNKIVIARRPDEATDEPPKPTQVNAPASSPLANAMADSLAAPLTKMVLESFAGKDRGAVSQAPAPAPAPALAPAVMTLADALPEGPALAAFFAKELRNTTQGSFVAGEEAPLSRKLEEEEEEEMGYRPPPRRNSIPQMIRPAAKPQEGDGPPPATLAAALARIVEDAAHETEAHAADHRPLELTEADIVEDAPTRASSQSSSAGSSKSAADMSPKEIEALIASTLNQISGLTNR